MSKRRVIKWDDESFKRQRAKKALLPENTTYSMDASEIVRRDMMFLAIALWVPLDYMIQKNENDISPEVPDAIHRSYALMTKNAPPAEKVVTAKKILDDVNTCLKATQSESGRGAALAAALLVCILTDEGLIRDPSSQIVLTSAAIIAEAQEDGPTDGWRFEPGAVNKAAQNLWERANLAGYLLSMA